MATQESARPKRDGGPPAEDECSLCMDRRRYLKLLPCGHCFCEYCLQRVVNDHPDTFPCPLCRAETSVPDRGASDFPFHVSVHGAAALGVSRVLETFPVGVEQGTAHVICDECGDEAGAYHCFRCQKAVCEFCRDSHRRDDPPLMPLPSFGRSSSGTRHSQCRRHKFQGLTHLCQQCEETLCLICVQSRDSPHKKHRVCLLEQAAEDAKGRLVVSRSNAERCSRRLQLAIEDLTHQENLLSQQRSTAEGIIRQRASEIRTLVDQLERDAVTALTDISSTVSGNLKKDISFIRCKAAALDAVQKELKRVLTADKKTEMVQTDLWANATIGKKDYFDKFIKDIPKTKYHLKVKVDLLENLTQPVKKVIGRPIVEQMPQKTSAAVVLVEKHVKLLQDRSQADITLVNFVCPVSDTEVWLGWLAENGQSSVGLYHKAKEVLIKEEVSMDQMVLTRFDAHSVLAQYNDHETILCLEGPNVTYPVERKQHFITNKGCVSACPFFASSDNRKTAYLNLNVTSAGLAQR